MFFTRTGCSEITKNISLHFVQFFLLKWVIEILSLLGYGCSVICRHRHMTAGHAGMTKNPHNYFISHFHTLGKFRSLDSLSALKNPVFVLKIFKILKILISVINIWKLWTEAAHQFDTKLMSVLSLTHTHTTAVLWLSCFLFSSLSSFAGAAFFNETR